MTKNIGKFKKFFLLSLIFSQNLCFFVGLTNNNKFRFITNSTTKDIYSSSSSPLNSQQSLSKDLNLSRLEKYGDDRDFTNKNFNAFTYGDSIKETQLGRYIDSIINDNINNSLINNNKFRSATDSKTKDIYSSSPSPLNSQQSLSKDLNLPWLEKYENDKDFTNKNFNAFTYGDLIKKTLFSRYIVQIQIAFDKFQSYILNNYQNLKFAYLGWGTFYRVPQVIEFNQQYFSCLQEKIKWDDFFNYDKLTFTGENPWGSEVIPYFLKQIVMEEIHGIYYVDEKDKENENNEINKKIKDKIKELQDTASKIWKHLLTFVDTITPNFDPKPLSYKKNKKLIEFLGGIISELHPTINQEILQKFDIHTDKNTDLVEWRNDYEDIMQFHWWFSGSNLRYVAVEDYPLLSANNYRNFYKYLVSHKKKNAQGKIINFKEMVKDFLVLAWYNHSILTLEKAIASYILATKNGQTVDQFGDFEEMTVKYWNKIMRTIVIVEVTVLAIYIIKPLLTAAEMTSQYAMAEMDKEKIAIPETAPETRHASQVAHDSTGQIIYQPFYEFPKTIKEGIIRSKQIFRDLHSIPYGAQVNNIVKLLRSTSGIKVNVQQITPLLQSFSNVTEMVFISEINRRERYDRQQIMEATLSEREIVMNDVYGLLESLRKYDKNLYKKLRDKYNNLQNKQPESGEGDIQQQWDKIVKEWDDVRKKIEEIFQLVKLRDRATFLYNSLLIADREDFLTLYSHNVDSLYTLQDIPQDVGTLIQRCKNTRNTFWKRIIERNNIRNELQQLESDFFLFLELLSQREKEAFITDNSNDYCLTYRVLCWNATTSIEKLKELIEAYKNLFSNMKRHPKYQTYIERKRQKKEAEQLEIKIPDMLRLLQKSKSNFLSNFGHACWDRYMVLYKKNKDKDLITKFQNYLKQFMNKIKLAKLIDEVAEIFALLTLDDRTRLVESYNSLNRTINNQKIDLLYYNTETYNSLFSGLINLEENTDLDDLVKQYEGFRDTLLKINYMKKVKEKNMEKQQEDDKWNNQLSKLKELCKEVFRLLDTLMNLSVEKQDVLENEYTQLIKTKYVPLFSDSTLTGNDQELNKTIDAFKKFKDKLKKKIKDEEIDINEEEVEQNEGEEINTNRNQGMQGRNNYDIWYVIHKYRTNPPNIINNDINEEEVEQNEEEEINTNLNQGMQERNNYDNRTNPPNVINNDRNPPNVINPSTQLLTYNELSEGRLTIRLILERVIGHNSIDVYALDNNEDGYMGYWVRINDLPHNIQDRIRQRWARNENLPPPPYIPLTHLIGITFVLFREEANLWGFYIPPYEGYGLVNAIFAEYFASLLKDPKKIGYAVQKARENKIKKSFNNPIAAQRKLMTKILVKKMVNDGVNNTAQQEQRGFFRRIWDAICNFFGCSHDDANMDHHEDLQSQPIQPSLMIRSNSSSNLGREGLYRRNAFSDDVAPGTANYPFSKPDYIDNESSYDMQDDEYGIILNDISTLQGFDENFANFFERLKNDCIDQWNIYSNNLQYSNDERTKALKCLRRLRKNVSILVKIFSIRKAIIDWKNNNPNADNDAWLTYLIIEHDDGFFNQLRNNLIRMYGTIDIFNNTVERLKDIAKKLNINIPK